MNSPDDNDRLINPSMAAGADGNELKTVLDEALMEHPQWGSRLKEFEKLGLVKPLKLNSGTWVSLTSSSGIFLGTAKMPEELRENLIFGGEEFDYQDEMVYRYGHEICHSVVSFTGRNSGCPEVKNLFNVLHAMRSDKKERGLTALGSFGFYRSQGPLVQASEDLFELTNMYLWDPEYFKRFLSFLVDKDSWPEQAKQDLGLVTIREEVAEMILKTIELSLKEGNF